MSSKQEGETAAYESQSGAQARSQIGIPASENAADASDEPTTQSRRVPPSPRVSQSPHLPHRTRSPRSRSLPAAIRRRYALPRLTCLPPAQSLSILIRVPVDAPFTPLALMKSISLAARSSRTLLQALSPLSRPSPLISRAMSDDQKMLQASLADSDPELLNLIKREQHRQINSLEMIASENFTSVSVLEALSTCLHNKYSEGYPGQRYVTGRRMTND